MGLGVVFLAAGAVAHLVNAPGALVVYLSIGGVLILGSVLAIRDSYRPEVDEQRGYWQKTGERFRDPASGHMMEVRYNPVTGQRDYVDVEGS